MWADFYADEKKLAQFKADLLKHTKQKDVTGNVSIRYLSDDTAAIVYLYEDEPAALISVDWADICLRITFVQW